MNRVVLTGIVKDVSAVAGSDAGVLLLVFGGSRNRSDCPQEVRVLARDLHEVQRGATVLVSGRMASDGEATIRADEVVVAVMAPGQAVADPAKRKFRTGHWRTIASGRRVFVSAHGRPEVRASGGLRRGR